MSLLAATLLLAGSTAVADAHHDRFDHAGGVVDVTYRATLVPHMRQVGAVSAPGRPATLHCRWQARVTVERQARHASGRSAGRRIEAPALASGSRPGWCTGQAEAIRAQVAAAGGRMRAHLVEVAARDRAVLVAELEQEQG